MFYEMSLKQDELKNGISTAGLTCVNAHLGVVLAQ